MSSQPGSLRATTNGSKNRPTPPVVAAPPNEDRGATRIPDPFTAAAKLDIALVVVVVVVVVVPVAVVGTVIGKRYRTLSDLRVPEFKIPFRKNINKKGTHPAHLRRLSLRRNVHAFFPSLPPRGGEGGSADASRWVVGCRLAASTDARARGVDNDDAEVVLLPEISAAAPRTSWIASGLIYPHGWDERRTPALYAAQRSWPDARLCRNAVRVAEGSTRCGRRCAGSRAARRACARARARLVRDKEK